MHPQSRAERRHHRNRVIRNRVKTILNIEHTPRDIPVQGIYNKFRPFSCNHAKCWLCHSERKGHPLIEPDPYQEWGLAI